MEESKAPLKRIRSPVVEGLFYPEDSAVIQNCLGLFEVQQGKGGTASAIIAPHGAWEISGHLAAEAFSAAGGRCGAREPKRVVLLGPIHDQTMAGLFLSNSHFFRTPLGDIPVEQQIGEELESCSKLFVTDDIPHLKEHSIEVLLPFVKYCFPKASIIPILMGKPRTDIVSALAHALKVVFEPLMDDTLLVVSCNFAVTANEAAARIQADECMKLLAEKNAAEFSAAMQDGRISPCGGGAALSLIKSGLVDSMRACPVSETMIHAKGEEHKSVYYGAIAYEQDSR